MGKREDGTPEGAALGGGGFEGRTCGTCARFARAAETEDSGACFSSIRCASSGRWGYGLVAASDSACEDWTPQCCRICRLRGRRPARARMRKGRAMAESSEISHPSHYASGEIECKDAMRSAMEGASNLPSMAFYWWGCAFKYLWRWRGKDGLKDLRKCQQCIDFLISEIEGKADDKQQ